MTNDNQTALMISIKRKKDRIFELEELNCNCSDCIMETKILTNLITEDEKLLPADREQIVEAFIDGWRDYDPELPFSTAAQKYYNHKYGTDGK